MNVRDKDKTKVMTKRSQESRHILQSSLTIGVICSMLTLTPLGTDLEEVWGLKVLFRLRGARPVPGQVALVSLDRNTAHQFDLPAEPEKWPRRVYAELIETLSVQGAAVIAIDVLFSELREAADDEALSAAIAKSGRVILVSDMKRDTVPIDNDAGQLIGSITVDSVQPPHAIFADHAQGIAPFPIPKALSVARQFWLYTDNNPHLVTFPVLALNALFARSAFRDVQPQLGALWSQGGVDLPKNQQELADDAGLHRLVALVADGLETLPGHPWADGLALPEYEKMLTAAWLATYRLGAQAHFNHYGPPGTIPTISASRMLSQSHGGNIDVRGKVVFIGYSEDLQPERNHGFFTDFSETAEAAVSSAELAAVAFANLLDRSALQPLARFGQALIALAWSLVLGVLVMRRLTLMRFALLVAVSALYGLVTDLAFRDRFVWLPYAIPLWIETPAILLVAATQQYLATRRERQRIYSAFRHYIPESVVDRILAEDTGPSANQGIAIDAGICLSTDAGQYTRIAESLDPMALASLMNRYYGVVFPRVTEAGGFVSDVVGDAVLALWIGEQEPARECQAVCHCALAMQAAVADFERMNQLHLPIRIGINAGPFRLGNVGSSDRLEYRATGDTVNTASRIENLSKRMGAGVLIADSVIRETSGFVTRRLGEFLLEGKTIPVVIHELMAITEPDNLPLQQRCARFAEAEQAYRSGHLDEALAMFEALANEQPEDGAAAFYLRHIANLKQMPRESWDLPVIAVRKH